MTPAHISVDRARVAVQSGLTWTKDGAVIEPTRWLGRKRLVRDGLISEAPTLAVAHNASWRNYYHFTMQTAFAAWQWLRSDLSRDSVLLTPPGLTQWQEEMFRMIGVRPKQRFTPHQLVDVVIPPTAYVMLDAFSAGPGGPVPAELPAFARRLLQMCVPGHPQVSPPRRIYITRRGGKRRPMTNEAELESALYAAGFHISAMERNTVAAQAKLFRDADLIVAPHGAGLTNMIFCKPGAHLIELTPSFYLNASFSRLAPLFRFTHERLAFAAEPCEGDARHFAPWQADVDQVLRAVRCFGRGR